jgi:hypothetical protein
MKFVAWFLLLVLQNAAFTWVSRARNSGSVGYHALASVCSNGIWFVSNLVMIGVAVKDVHGWQSACAYGSLYIAGTVTGSVLMHYVSIKWLETGKRRVGG